MKFSNRTICPIYGSEILSLLAHHENGTLLDVGQEYLLLRINTRLILLTSDMNLLGPFTIIVPSHTLTNLEIELTLGDGFSLDATKRRLTFESANQVLQLLAHPLTDNVIKESGLTVSQIGLETLIDALLNFLNRNRHVLTWHPTFLTHTPTSFTDLLVSLTLSFTTTLWDPQAELNEKWMGLNEMEIFINSQLGRLRLDRPSLNEFMEQWEFKGARLASFLGDLLPRKAHNDPSQRAFLSPVERMLLGYVSGLAFTATPESPLAKDLNFMEITTYVWGKAAERTGEIFKEIFFYLTKKTSFSAIENLCKQASGNNFVRLLYALDDFSRPRNSFGMEFLLGVLCQTLQKGYFISTSSSSLSITPPLPEKKTSFQLHSVR